MLLAATLLLACLAPVQLQDLQSPTVDPAGKLLAFVDPGRPARLLVTTLDPRRAKVVVSGASQPLTDIQVHSPHQFVAGGRLVFLADRVVDQRFEVWSVGADLVPLRLSDGGNVYRFETDPARTRVVFGENGRLQVRAVDGTGTPLALGPTDALAVVAQEVSPDGTRVAFVTKHSPFNLRLWIQPLDGSQPPTLLKDGLFFWFSGIEDEEAVTRLTFTPEGTHLLFGELTGPILGRRYLSVVPTDASAPSGALPVGLVTPERTSVLHVGPELRVLETDVLSGRTHLLVGSRARQSEPSVASPAMLSLSNDGQFVLLVVKHSVGAYSLYAAPRQGAGEFERLVDLPPGDAPSLLFSGSGQLLFQHRASGAARLLQRVPLDGSAPPLTLGSLSHWTSLTGSRATIAAGNEIVFLGTLAGQPLEGVWRVALDGSSPAELLTAQPIDPLLLSGGFVVGTDRTDFSTNLWGLPLDGSFAPLRYD